MKNKNNDPLTPINDRFALAIILKHMHSTLQSVIAADSDLSNRTPAELDTLYHEWCEVRDAFRAHFEGIDDTLGTYLGTIEAEYESR